MAAPPLRWGVMGTGWIAERFVAALQDARELFAASALAREALGDEVVDHYLNAATVELEAFGAAVTDWERVRGFERL